MGAMELMWVLHGEQRATTYKFIRKGLKKNHPLLVDMEDGSGQLQEEGRHPLLSSQMEIYCVGF